MTSVILVDDHPVFRDGLSALLSSVDIEVLATAATGEQAVTIAREADPDVVIMDLHMPGMNGIEATSVLTGSGSRARILVLSMLDDDDSVFAALRAGASGYVLKDAGQEEIIRAIEAVARGEVIFGSSIAQRVLEHLSGNIPAARTFPELTPREHEILELVAEGASNQSIARRLFLSEKTVRNNVSNVLTKLHVSGRPEAIVKAREAGLGRSKPEPDSR
jgi:DNA-binding NarL/FixJ family response regulator